MTLVVVRRWWARRGAPACVRSGEGYAQLGPIVLVLAVGPKTPYGALGAELDLDDRPAVEVLVELVP